MRKIHTDKITDLVEKLCVQANVVLPQEMKDAFAACKKAERSPLGREIFDKMEENYRIAEERGMPVCQDTGMAVVFVELGQEVYLEGAAFEDAVNEGVRRGYVNGYLRLSVVRDPLDRVNTNDNTPAVIHTRIVPGDKIRITVAPKGFGSENMSAMKMFTPAAVPDDIVDFIVSSVETAGSNPCPPVVVGVGLGGTIEMAALCAKKALMREDGPVNEFYAGLEADALRRINALGIVPQGLGGTVTALKVNILPYPTHIAGLPCVVNMGCHITRHAAGEI